MNHCRHPACRAAIRWATTTKGRRIPLDPRPSIDGNGRLDFETNVVTILSGTELEAARAAREQLYTAHKATCAGARDFDRHRAARAVGAAGRKVE